MEPESGQDPAPRRPMGLLSDGPPTGYRNDYIAEQSWDAAQLIVNLGKSAARRETDITSGRWAVVTIQGYTNLEMENSYPRTDTLDNHTMPVPATLQNDAEIEVLRAADNLEDLAMYMSYGLPA